MSKVFVRHTFDMNDADYVYGCQIVEKEEWEKFKEWVEKKNILAYIITMMKGNVRSQMLN